jgi:hypothetical protein
MIKLIWWALLFVPRAPPADGSLEFGSINNHDKQPAMVKTKAGGGWQESIDKATTRPRQWAMTNDESVWQMVMAATKRARMARAMWCEGGCRSKKRVRVAQAMALATRLASYEEGNGNSRQGWQMVTEKANNNQPSTG